MRINKSLITYIPTSGSGSGTVTSVAMTVPVGVFFVLGSPITSSGTLQVGLTDQIANTVWAGPTSGGESIPTFRGLVSDDIPTLNVSKITGAVPSTRLLTINGTSQDLSADRTFNIDSITSLTGEATGSGTGAVAVTLTNSAVIGKVLTGLSIAGGTIASTDTILTAFGKLQSQVNGVLGGVVYRGTWNASTNTPTIISSAGSKGDYYIVSVAGSTNVDGINDWKIGDWIIFNGTVWDKVDNTEAVASVNGYTGIVTLTTSDIAEGTNLYYTDTRARAAITLTTSGTSGASTYSGGTLNIPNYSLSGLGGVPTSRTITINGTAQDLSADRTFSVGTVTSVGLATSTTAITIGSSPISTSGSMTIDIATADTSQSGLISATDWNTFNNKMSNPMTTLGDIIIARSLGDPFRFAGNASTTRKYFSQIGNGSAVTASSWEEISATTLGVVPTSRTITINDVVFDLSANRSWDVGDYGTW